MSRPVRGFAMALVALFLSPFSLVAQTTVRLPLPVDSPAESKSFEALGPTATVLTGFLLPASGPLTSWAPVWSSLGADGSLTETQVGGWTGPRPEKWIKVVRAGSVVGGFRFLVRTGPGSVQTRQAQIFWKPWVDGEPQGAVVTSRVYGLAAGANDQVRIIELKLPEGSVPTGLYGQTVGGPVAQVSLIVRQPPAPAATAPTESGAPSGARAPATPTVKSAGPSEPSVPPVVLAPPPPPF